MKVLQFCFGRYGFKNYLITALLMNGFSLYPDLIPISPFFFFKVYFFITKREK